MATGRSCCKVGTLMKTPLQISTSATHSAMVSSAGETASPEATPKPPLYRQIKLALDVHAADLSVVRMVDEAKPQPPQQMTPPRFL